MQARPALNGVQPELALGDAPHNGIRHHAPDRAQAGTGIAAGSVVDGEEISVHGIRGNWVNLNRISIVYHYR